MDESINCPHCNKTVMIGQAMVQALQQKYLKAAQEQHAAEIETLKQQQARDQQAQINQLKIDWEKSQQMASLEISKQLESEKSNSSQLRQKIEELLDDKARSKLDKENYEIEIKERLQEQTEVVRQETLKQAEAIFRSQLEEKDKKIADVQKQAQELQLKTSQTSAQLKGEVLELSLEESFKQAFPDDLIEEVGKGVRGADILQTVRNSRGTDCGLIIWESKRTKKWGNDWISKLKEDSRIIKAHIPAMVSVTFPSEIKENPAGIIYYQGIWIAQPASALILASLLRLRLLEVKQADLRSQHRSSAAEDLYNYVTGHEFRQNIMANLEVYADFKQTIAKERNALEKIWAKREQQIDKLFKNTVQMIGSMEGLIGSDSMPRIEGLQIENLLSDKNKSSS